MDFRRKGKTVIGLTGGISGGKSTALEIFKELGALTICADELSKKYFEIFKDKIREAFASCDRAEIAARIFKDDVKRKWLENLLHPFILKEAAEIINSAEEKIIIFDLPLLFEAGLENSFDLTLCIYADDKIRLSRAVNKGFKAEDFKARDLKQTPLWVKAQKADIVIYNNESRKELKDKTERFFNILNKKPMR
ncbi:MAG: dephospho-CoA kinase [Elusimicrobia bacterium]|nr:dephospho-CoA kinase [Elusimicrobiota bacterium]